MQTHTILIISGTLLLLAGVIGGGLSLKEIKLPSLDKFSRALASIVGIALIVAGVYIEGQDPDSGVDANSSISERNAGIQEDRDQSDQQRTDEQGLREEEERQADIQRAEQQQQLAEEQRLREEEERRADIQRAEEQRQLAEAQRLREEEERQADIQRAEEQRQLAEEQRLADRRMAALQWREEYEAQGGRIVPVGEFEQRHESSRLFEVAEHRFPVRACPDCDFGFVFQCRTPVTSIDELKHLTVRAHNDILAQGIQPHVGEIAVFPAAEIYQALQTGAIDCYCAAVRL